MVLSQHWNVRSWEEKSFKILSCCEEQNVWNCCSLRCVGEWIVTKIIETSFFCSLSLVCPFVNKNSQECKRSKIFPFYIFHKMSSAGTVVKWINICVTTQCLQNHQVSQVRWHALKQQSCFTHLGGTERTSSVVLIWLTAFCLFK